MKRLFSLILAFLLVVSVLSVKAQKLIRNSEITGVCYAGNKVTRIYIPPSDDYLRKGSTKLGGSVTIYYTGFSAEAKTAMEYAAAILERMLPEDAIITIQARWERNSNAGVLGQSSITGYVGGWSVDALNPIAIYPVALAEKIAGENFTDDLTGDIDLSINSSINWYLGIDGNTPTNRYDLVTVALHEICHGLGFFDSMDANSNIGSYGFSSIPMIYDTFLETLEGKKLTDTLTFPNYSNSLYRQLTGGRIFFNGPVLTNYTSGNRARIYAPSTWNAGSSISHLDEDQVLSRDALMTPFIDLGEAIHDPGKLTFSILGDLGWINTRIIHTPLKSTEENLTEINLSVNIKSDTAYNRNKVGAVYSFDSFNSSDTVYLSSPAGNDDFSAKISIPSYNTDLQYYLFAEDHFRRLYRSPSLYEEFRYQVYIGKDTVKPVISHNPVSYYLETVDSLSFKASVTDNTGIDTVYIEYKKNTGPSKYLGLKSLPSDDFVTVFSADGENLAGGDSIQYRIYAVDLANTANVSVYPKTGYQVIDIEDIKSTLDSYSTNFFGAAGDFFNTGFEIARPVGFSQFGLHTKHPYVSPEDNDETIEYTALLRHPVLMNESGLFIKFSEIVLVEPGEAGSVFGSEEFYDYVVIEGSKNFGKNWFPLIDGYDSRILSSWETTYNSSIVEQNSTAKGDASMLKERTIYASPSDKISAGDTMLLRFRLFSDPFANGWGWVIEDLKINPLIDDVEELTTEEISLYPNPGNGVIKIRSKNSIDVNGKPLKLSVFNSAGTYIVKDRVLDDGETVIDISQYPTGLYIISIYQNQRLKTFKYTLIK